MPETQWPRFMVFVNERENVPWRHFGTVHAPDDDVNFICKSVVHFHLFDVFSQRVQHFVVGGALDKQAGAGNAFLPRGAEYSPLGAAHRCFHIGVGKNDVWRFAAQFKADALQIALGGRSHDFCTDLCGAGESQFTNTHVSGHGCASG